MTLFFLFGGINFGSQFEGYSPWWQGKTWQHGCEASDPIVSTIRKQRRVNPGAWPNFSFYSAKDPRSWFGNSVSCQWRRKSISVITAVCSAMSGRFCTVWPSATHSNCLCTISPPYFNVLMLEGQWTWIVLSYPSLIQEQKSTML